MSLIPTAVAMTQDRVLARDINFSSYSSVSMIKEISLLKDISFANTYYLNINVRERDTKLVIKKKTLERRDYIQICCLR